MSYCLVQRMLVVADSLQHDTIFSCIRMNAACGRPTSDGSAAAILASEAFVRKHGLQSQAVEMLAQSMATDLPSTFTEKNVMKMVRLSPVHLFLLFETRYAHLSLGPWQMNNIPYKKYSCPGRHMR